MSARRGTSGLCGVLVIDKPAGCTSHDVVARVRRACGERRVGHAGTLDPAATGVLVVLVGPYTRLEPYLSKQEKAYEATISFGRETDTDDAEGTVTREGRLPSSLADESFAREVLSGFEGESLQMPPAYSAIKVDGRVAHRAARAGEALELTPRPIIVHQAVLIGIQGGEAPSWDAAFRVSKGTYIRSLARDIGRAAGSAAHLSALRRTASGCASLAHARTLEEVESQAANGQIASLFHDPVELIDLPVLECAASDIADGRPIAAPSPAHPRYAIVVQQRLAAVYRHEGNTLRAEAVFPTPMGAEE